MGLSIIIPCYNEGSRPNEHIKDNILYLNTVLETNIDSYEIILVSDGSTDNTQDLLSDVASTNPRIRLISYKHNMGKGYAISTGQNIASYEYILYMDADFPVRLNSILNFYTLMQNDNALSAVIGTRVYVRKQSIPRKVLSRLSAFCMHNILKIAYPDTQCGFKLIRHSVLSDFCINHMSCNKWLFDAELLLYMQVNSFKVACPEVFWCNNVDSKLKLPSGIVTSCISLVKVWRARKSYRSEK